MAINWVAVYNRLFEIINTPGDTYYKGSYFLDVIRKVNYGVPSYNNFLEERRKAEKSTSRRDYYYDALMDQSEEERIKIVSNILDDVGRFKPEETASIRQLIGIPSQIQGPQAIAHQNLWNADRLNEYLDEMDKAIDQAKYEYALTLAYTCLEGFYKAFIKEKIPSKISTDELTPMAVLIRDFIGAHLDSNGINYPSLTLKLVSTVTNAVCHARNNFSDSHSGDRAEKWVAIYLRDNVNAIAKLLMHFM